MTADEIKKIITQSFKNRIEYLTANLRNTELILQLGSNSTLEF